MLEFLVGAVAVFVLAIVGLTYVAVQAYRAYRNIRSDEKERVDGK
jgi:hypothetical protein